MNTLGQNIRFLRQQQGFSQADVAKQLDVSIPAFSKIETGITDINLSRLEQIATLFKLTAVQLLAMNDANGEIRPEEFDLISQRLAIRENEVIDLQKKVIQLFEELRLVKANV